MVPSSSWRLKLLWKIYSQRQGSAWTRWETTGYRVELESLVLREWVCFSQLTTQRQSAQRLVPVPTARYLSDVRRASVTEMGQPWQQWGTLTEWGGRGWEGTKRTTAWTLSSIFWWFCSGSRQYLIPVNASLTFLWMGMFTGMFDGTHYSPASGIFCLHGQKTWQLLFLFMCKFICQHYMQFQHFIIFFNLWL